MTSVTVPIRARRPATRQAADPYSRGGRSGISMSRRDEEFQAYVELKRGSLVRSATLLTSGDRHRAEDLVQIALVKLYLAWGRIRGATVDAYALRVLTNVFIDEYRRPSFRQERLRAELPELPDEPDHELADEVSDAIRALADLPPRMRAAVVLRHLHELSVAETAIALGCNEGTVKSQTARGLAQIRERLTESRSRVPGSQRRPK